MPSPPIVGTGVSGLDDIIRGGFPRGRLFLIEGDPGVGKTTFALQFLLEGRARGERCVYVTLSETKEELEAVARSHDWSLEGMTIFELNPPGTLDPDEMNTLFHPSEVELAETTRAVVELCERERPSRVVFDSLSEIRLLAQSAIRYRREVLSLKQYFSRKDCTVLLLDDRTGDFNRSQLQSIAHGVIALDQLAPLYGAQRRRLRVEKLRGVDFRGGYHDFIIQRGGLCVFPRLVAAEHLQPHVASVASSGVPALDQMVGGGLDRGTSTLLLGPAGTGKSSMALQWVVAGAARGERAVVYAFDESRATLLTRMESLGVGLTKYVEDETVLIRQVDPAEIPPGQFAAEVRVAVETRGVRSVVIDSLNGYMQAMPDESFLVLQLHELLTYLGQRGIVTILVAAQHGLVGGSMTSPTDVSYLADTVFLTRHYETGGSLRKAISVLKKRTGAHEHSIRELVLSSNGVSAGPPLSRFHGVFTGVPLEMDGEPSERRPAFGGAHG